MLIPKRDFDLDSEDDDFSSPDYWGRSSEATAIRCGILFGILGLALVVIVGSYFHAQHRLKRGLAPLVYHRWLVPVSQRALYEPHLREPEQNFSFYNGSAEPGSTAPGYDMHAVPPPVYNPHAQQPPMYVQQPPAYSGIDLGTPLPKGRADPFLDPPGGGEGSGPPPRYT